MGSLGLNFGAFMRINPVRGFVAILVLLAGAWGVQAEDLFYRVKLSELKITAGEIPRSDASSRGWRIREALLPYVRLAGAGEAYCVGVDAQSNRLQLGDFPSRELFVRAPAGADVVGKVYLPNAKLDGMAEVGFAIPRGTTPVSAKEFWPGKIAYYDALVARQLPGSAWFRYQADEARKALGTVAGADAANNVRPALDRIDDTMGLFTGGRALSENLPLDRGLRVNPGNAAKMVDIGEINGITIREMDWKPLIKDKHPELDPLAYLIPADQHAIFFPTFAAFVAVADEADNAGTPVVQLIEPRSEDAGVKGRYQRQMCLSLTGLGRLTIGDAVVVTNSLPQLQRLAWAQAKQVPSLASLPEYTFFRDRYKRGEGGESALVVLSDATIRRWCGPKWRIADSRRARAGAILAGFQAEYADALAKNTVIAGPIPTERTDLGEMSISRSGVASSVYGTLDFMTPIGEMDVEKVSGVETQAYERWRDTYQRNWSQYFDPIAIRLCVSGKKLSADVTVTPLIAATEYATIRDVSAGVKLSDAQVDQHDSLLHLALSIDTNSNTIKQWSNLGQNLGPGINLDILGWIGKSASIYVDDDPYWTEMAKADDPEKFLTEHTENLPVALSIEVSNPLKLALFLASARLYIEASSPGLATWTPVVYKTSAYTKVEPTEVEKRQAGIADKRAIYYAAMPDQLVISFNENVIKRAIDRHLERVAAKLAGKALPAPARPFVGQNMALQLDAKMAGMLGEFLGSQFQSQFQLRAWANIPILNEYKRLYPDQDPIALHEKLWHTRLTCPGGGNYVWNEKWQTMESMVYGHPGEPKRGPALPPALKGFSFGNCGIDFQENGIRARVELEKSGK